MLLRFGKWHSVDLLLDTSVSEELIASIYHTEMKAVCSSETLVSTYKATVLSVEPDDIVITPQTVFRIGLSQISPGILVVSSGGLCSYRDRTVTALFQALSDLSFNNRSTIRPHTVSDVDSAELRMWELMALTFKPHSRTSEIPVESSTAVLHDPSLATVWSTLAHHRPCGKLWTHDFTEYACYELEKFFKQVFL
jgi:hypothetical protein